MSLNTNALLKAAGIGAAAVFILTLLTFIPFVGIVCCCLLYLGYAGVGVLYGYFAKQNIPQVDAGSAALGGAVAAAIAGLVYGIVNGAVFLITSVSGGMSSYLRQLEDLGFYMPPEVYQLYTGIGGGLLIAALSICWGIVIGAVLGAIGGAIYGATQKGSAAPAV